MIKLNPEEIPSWLQRFNSFNDAVIRRWQIGTTDSGVTYNLAIETMDSASANTGWSKVTLQFRDCTSFSYFCESSTNYNVLSNGMNILVDGPVIYADFGHFASLPASLEELMQSPCHAASPDIAWHAIEIGD